MNTNGKNIDFELIARHLSGETGHQEEQELNAWLESAAENRRLFEEYKTLWNKLDRVEDIASLDLDTEWKHLESLIDESRPMADAGREKGRSFLFLTGRLAAAAVIVMALVFGGLYTSRNVGHRTLSTAGVSLDVSLPDGSGVTLNSYSSLKYPKKFKKDQRSVHLEGEAFFEVSGNPEWPFVITTTEVDIRVLGTSFNVNAYESNAEIEVIVKTGQVAVTRHGEVPETVILKPGNKAVYDRSSRDLNLTANTDRNYLAWKTRSFIFEDQTLHEVAAALNKVYGSEIIIPSDSLKEARITTNFHEQSLEAILNILSATLDLQVIDSGKQILLEESN